MEMQCKRIAQTQYEFGGFMADYLDGVTAQWLKVAPGSNPAMLEMFRDRDRRPLGPERALPDAAANGVARLAHGPAAPAAHGPARAAGPPRRPVSPVFAAFFGGQMAFGRRVLPRGSPKGRFSLAWARNIRYRLLARL